MGTAEYGTPGGPTSLSYWSIKFNTIAFDKFLFTRDDCEKWLITSKEAVLGSDGNTWYADELRTIIASSISNTSYEARWYRRPHTYAEDPMISITDHHTAVGTGEIVYAESSAPSPDYIWGANVYINSATYSPTILPTFSPSSNPSSTEVPTRSPTEVPTRSPTKVPTRSPIISPTVIPTTSPTILPTEVPTQSPTISPTVIPTSLTTSSNVEENCPESVGELWTLVRHTPPGRYWHQANDNLMGTDEYGTPGGPTSLSYWSIKFNTIAFDKFLFTRDDCEKWLITSKEAVLGPDGNAWYANVLRTIIASSISNTSYEARWYRRPHTYAEDPMISITDHHTAAGTGEIVYAESSTPSPDYIWGANVYINNATYSPSQVPTRSPTEVPTRSPTISPTVIPTTSPSILPTYTPSSPSSTEVPTRSPTEVPTRSPTISQTVIPTTSPTILPSEVPTRSPTVVPTVIPTSPTILPTVSPTIAPTGAT